MTTISEILVLSEEDNIDRAELKWNLFSCAQICVEIESEMCLLEVFSVLQRGGVTRNPLTMIKLEITVGFTNKHGTLSTIKNTLDI